jgi:Domain of unknown function (DUF6468)
MIESYLPLMIEGLVAILLVLTIGYCYVLNRKLKALRMDETALKTSLIELLSATEVAERAIKGLKTTVHECDINLNSRLTEAQKLASNLDDRIKDGGDVVRHIGQIVMAARQASESGLTVNSVPAIRPKSESLESVDDEPSTSGLASTARALATRLEALRRGRAA